MVLEKIPNIEDPAKNIVRMVEEIIGSNVA